MAAERLMRGLAPGCLAALAALRWSAEASGELVSRMTMSTTWWRSVGAAADDRARWCTRSTVMV